MLSILQPRPSTKPSPDGYSTLCFQSPSAVKGHSVGISGRGRTGKASPLTQVVPYQVEDPTITSQ